MQMGFNAPKNEWELLRQEQVGRQINISVLFLKNEVEFSIYKFLTTRTKKTKKQPQSIELGSTGSLAVGVFNAWQVTVTLNRRSIGKANTLTGKTNTSIGKREPVNQYPDRLSLLASTSIDSPFFAWKPIFLGIFSFNI